MLTLCCRALPPLRSGWEPMSKNPSTGNITHAGITGMMMGGISGRILHTRIAIVPILIMGDRDTVRMMPDTKGRGLVRHAPLASAHPSPPQYRGRTHGQWAEAGVGSHQYSSRFPAHPTLYPTRGAALTAAGAAGRGRRFRQSVFDALASGRLSGIPVRLWPRWPRLTLRTQRTERPQIW